MRSPHLQVEVARDRLPISRAEFARQVQEALAHLHDFTHLQTHPLARSLPRLPAGPARPTLSVGAALRQALLDAIEALRPEPAQPSGGPLPRGHQLLTLRYVEGLDAQAVQSRLAIAKSRYYVEHRRALEALVSLLWERWRLSERERSQHSLPEHVANDGAGEVTATRAREAQPRVRPPSNLPLSLTSFVGREREIAEVREFLKRARLLTLTGSGGCGKTRLALEVARSLLEDAPEDYPDGVWLVELASLGDPELVANRVADVLHLGEQSGRPILAVLLDHLALARALLVLDNCEHLVEGCARLVAEMLQRCPGVTILTTSREALRIEGEVVWRVPSLTVPPVELPSDCHLTEYEAVRLFVDRARAAEPRFQFAPEDELAVAQVCWRLDGMPLAIELAAARVRVLTAAQIASRLGKCFELLTAGSRVALPQHQTLKAAIDWSHDLLSEPEKALLRRLAVFSGGWTLEAAEAVCASGVIRAEGFDLLSLLVDKSLVLVDVTLGEARYRLLETIREYAREQLATAGEAEGVRAKHREWYVAFGERVEPELWGPNQAARKQTLETEHDNLRGALESCLESDAEAGLRLAGSIWRFWADRGYLTEGCRWLEAVLAAEAEGTGQRAWCLYALGYLLATRGEYGRARSLMEESTGLLRALGESRRLAWVLADLGMVPESRGDFAGARALFEEGLALSRELGDPFCIALALRRLGRLVHGQGDLTRARTLLDECLVLVNELDNQRMIDWTLSGLGALAQAEGDYARARALLEQSLSMARRDEHKIGVILALTGLGNLARAEGEYEVARERLEEAISLGRRIGSILAPVETHASLGELARVQGDYARASALLREGLAFCSRHGHAFTSAYLGLLGMSDAGRGDYSRGVRLIGASKAQGGFVGLLYLWDPRKDRDALLAAARAALGEAGYSTAWAGGQAMTLDEAVEYALER